MDLLSNNTKLKIYFTFAMALVYCRCTFLFCLLPLLLILCLVEYMFNPHYFTSHKENKAINIQQLRTWKRHLVKTIFVTDTRCIAKLDVFINNVIHIADNEHWHPISHILTLNIDECTHIVDIEKKSLNEIPIKTQVKQYLEHTRHEKTKEKKLNHPFLKTYKSANIEDWAHLSAHLEKRSRNRYRYKQAHIADT